MRGSKSKIDIPSKEDDFVKRDGLNKSDKSTVT